MAQHRTRRPTAKEGEQITPEQLRAAQEWLEETCRAEPSSPLLPQLMEHAIPVSLSAVVEALSTMATPEAATLLTQIAATTDAKEVQKAARRALYRLKTMGVDTDSVRIGEPRKSVLEVPKLPIVIALASQIDFAGNRALYLARRRPFSGLVLVSLILSDQRGVLDCNAFPVTKKELTRIVADIQADDRLTHVELPPTYAQQLVEESYRRNLSTGTPVPQDFQGLHDLIGMPDTPWEQGPIYHLINPEEIRGQPAWLALAGQLLDVKEFQGWHVPPEAVQKYREEVRHAGESLIIVSPALQQERWKTCRSGRCGKCSIPIPVHAIARVWRRWPTCCGRPNGRMRPSGPSQVPWPSRGKELTQPSSHSCGRSSPVASKWLRHWSNRTPIG